MIVLILGRAIQGFGGGLLSGVAYVAMGRGYPESCRPRMMALLSTAWVVPGLIGPAISGLTADHIGWRWVFLGLAPMPVLALFLALPAIRRISAGSSATRNWRRLRAAAHLAAGMALFLTGLGLSRPHLAVPPVVVGLAVATGIGSVLIDLFSAADTAERAGIAWQFVLMIAVLALAFLAAARLPNRLSQTTDAAEAPTEAKSAEALVSLS